MALTRGLVGARQSLLVTFLLCIFVRSSRCVPVAAVVVGWDGFAVYVWLNPL